MLIFRTRKKPLFPLLILLFITIQTVACSSEDSFSAQPNNPNSGGGIELTTTENSPAIIGGMDSGNVTEDLAPNSDNFLEINGKLTITDSDVAESLFLEMVANGKYGSLTINNSGNWHYLVDNSLAIIQNLTAGSSLVDLLTIRSIDGTSHQITITILGVNEANNPAVISGMDTGNLVEDTISGTNNLVTTGKLNISDKDPNEEVFIEQLRNSLYGRLSLYASGFWIYRADNNQAVIQNLNSGQTLTDTININSYDGTPHVITISIAGKNEPSTTADITINWTAPIKREDNTPIVLSEITGFKIYYGTTQGKYNNSVTINDGSETQYLFKDLLSGTYYFALTTLDTDGRESAYSTEVLKSI